MDLHFHESCSNCISLFHGWSLIELQGLLEIKEDAAGNQQALGCATILPQGNTKLILGKHVVKGVEKGLKRKLIIIENQGKAKFCTIGTVSQRHCFEERPQPQHSRVQT
jgi:hypothetical protein